MQILAGAGQHTVSSREHWIEHFRVPDLSCGTYSIPDGGDDPQTPHTEDEIYVCTAGQARLVTPTGSALLTAGSVAFVPALEEHRFVEATSGFTVLVIFGPAEESRAGSS